MNRVPDSQIRARVRALPMPELIAYSNSTNSGMGMGTGTNDINKRDLIVLTFGMPIALKILE